MNQKRGGRTINVWYSRENKSYTITRAVANSLTLEFNSLACTQETVEDLRHGKGKCSILWILFEVGCPKFSSSRKRNWREEWSCNVPGLFTHVSTERFWWGFLALLQIGDLHLCSSCQHKVLGINVPRAEHSTSVAQMNMQPTPLFKMQTEHGPDSSAELKHCKLQPVVSTEWNLLRGAVFALKAEVICCLILCIGLIWLPAKMLEVWGNRQHRAHMAAHPLGTWVRLTTSHLKLKPWYPSTVSSWVLT